MTWKKTVTTTYATGCKCERTMSISGKTSDMFSCNYGDIEHVGYVPEGIVIGDGGYGDYIQFAFCLDCGKIQGKFPISDERIKKAIEDA